MSGKGFISLINNEDDNNECEYCEYIIQNYTKHRLCTSSKSKILTVDSDTENRE